jgi:hypothetical protein
VEKNQKQKLKKNDSFFLHFYSLQKNTNVAKAIGKLIGAS